MTGGFGFSIDFSDHISNFLDTCFMIDFRNIGSP